MRFIDAAIEDVSQALRPLGVDRDPQIADIVTSIIADVRARGDAAVLENGRRFDAPNLSAITLGPGETGRALAQAPVLWREAISLAALRIRRFHSEQAIRFLDGLAPGTGWGPNGGSWTVPTENVGQRVRPLNSIGAYVPGGQAAYPSSVLMTVIPALAASVSNVYVGTPAQTDGSLAPAMHLALSEAGASGVFKMGGAAAIAAFAFGTETVPKVDKIVGPGNKFVNEAKRQVWGSVGLDGYAGPSEVCVVVDASANPRWAAADLITQVEHASDNLGILLSTSKRALEATLAEIRSQAASAQRSTILQTALATRGLAILAKDEDQLIDIINQISPEHLTLMVRDPESVAERIHNAGCILVGDFTPQSAADWVLGPSHTIPTNGASRFGSPLSILDFVKVQSLSRLSSQELGEMLGAIDAFGAMEGFPAHSAGTSIRFET